MEGTTINYDDIDGIKVLIAKDGKFYPVILSNDSQYAVFCVVANLCEGINSKPIENIGYDIPKIKTK